MQRKIRLFDYNCKFASYCTFKWPRGNTHKNTLLPCGRNRQIDVCEPDFKAFGICEAERLIFFILDVGSNRKHTNTHTLSLTYQLTIYCCHPIRMRLHFTASAIRFICMYILWEGGNKWWRWKKLRCEDTHISPIVVTSSPWMSAPWCVCVCGAREHFSTFIVPEKSEPIIWRTLRVFFFLILFTVFSLSCVCN